jgi:hypothetical protein
MSPSGYKGAATVKHDPEGITAEPEGSPEIEAALARI